MRWVHDTSPSGKLAPKSLTVPGSKISLNDLCRVLALPGKPDGMDGSQVERYVNEGRIDEVSAYSQSIPRSCRRRSRGPVLTL